MDTLKILYPQADPEVVLELAELVSEGQTFYANAIPLEFSEVLAPGDTGDEVRVIQYLLSVVSEFYSNVPPVTVDGIDTWVRVGQSLKAPVPIVFIPE